METITYQNVDFWTTCKRLFSLALPMAGSQLISVASGFLCMAMLAKLGHEVLAASALIFTTQLSIMVSGLSILFSLSVLVGHAYGAKEYRHIGNYVLQGWTIGLLLSIPIMILFWNIDTLLLFFGESHEICDIVRSYFHAFVWAVIPGFLSTSNMQFGYGIHKKALIVTTSILSVIVLLVSAYALIFGTLGMPALGVAGLGYATAAQYSFFFLFTMLYFYFEKSYKRFDLFRYRAHKNREQFIRMLKIGWPISVQMGGEMLSFFVSGVMIGWLGSVSLAAFQVVNQYYFLIVIPIFSLSQASGILVAHACGAKQFHEVKNLSHASLAIVLVASLLVGGVFLLFPTSLATFYMDVNDPANATTLQLSILLFAITAFSQAFDGFRNIFIGILRGLFDTRVPMHMSLITIWIVGMPLSYILAFPFGYGTIGFVMGGALGMLSGAVLMLHRGYKISNKY